VEVNVEADAVNSHDEIRQCFVASGTALSQVVFGEFTIDATAQIGKRTTGAYSNPYSAARLAAALRVGQANLCLMR
jgi:hypothetical protein